MSDGLRWALEGLAYVKQVRGALAARPELLARLTAEAVGIAEMGVEYGGVELPVDDLVNMAVEEAMNDVLEEVGDAFYAIAAADGEPHLAEEYMIARIEARCPIGDYELAADGRKGAADTYAVLGVEPGATDGELRAAHRKLVRTYHPDRLVSKGLPDEFMKFAKDRLAAINAAYETVQKERQAR